MKIENLKCFLAVVRTKSLRKAADELFLAPQNLSIIIKNIEDDVGETLFERTSKGMFLTPEGEHFLPYVNAIDKIYNEYFESKKAVYNNLVLYTTQAIANDLDLLQGEKFQDQYYLSVQKRSRTDLVDMINKNVPGIYLLMMNTKDLHEIYVERASILTCSEIVTISCRNNQIVQNHSNKSKPLEYAQDCFEGEYYLDQNYLRIYNLDKLKELLQNSNAIYHCLSYHYFKFFQETNTWRILQKREIPTHEMALLFCGNYPDEIKTELQLRIKRIYL